MAKSKKSKPVKYVEEIEGEELVDATAPSTEVATAEYAPLYWRGNVHITGIGLVSGLARPEHVEAFKKLVGPNVLLSKWLKLTDDKQNYNSKRKFSKKPLR